jgi:hypothetical protein
LPSSCQDKPPRDGHDDDNIVEAHLGDIDQVDGEDLVAHDDALAAVDGRLESDPRDEDSVSPIHPVPLPDVEAERLPRTLHNFHEAGARVGVICVDINLGSRLTRQSDELARVKLSDNHLPRLLHSAKRLCCALIIPILNGLDLPENLI